MRVERDGNQQWLVIQAEPGTGMAAGCREFWMQKGS